MSRREVRCSDVEGCVGPACRLPGPHSTSAAWFPGVRARAREPLTPLGGLAARPGAAAALWRVVWGPHAGCQGPTDLRRMVSWCAALARSAECRRSGGHVSKTTAERAVAPGCQATCLAAPATREACFHGTLQRTRAALAVVPGRPLSDRSSGARCVGPACRLPGPQQTSPHGFLVCAASRARATTPRAGSNA